MTDDNSLLRQRQNYVFFSDAVYSVSYGVSILFFSQPELTFFNITSQVLLLVTSCSLGYVLWDAQYSNNAVFRKGACQIQCINHLAHHAVVWGAFYYYRGGTFLYGAPTTVSIISLLNLPFGIIYLFFGFYVSPEECEINEDEESNKAAPLLACDHAIPLEGNIK